LGILTELETVLAADQACRCQDEAGELIALMER
jgi:hypothetical protein